MAGCTKNEKEETENSASGSYIEMPEVILSETKVSGTPNLRPKSDERDRPVVGTELPISSEQRGQSSQKINHKNKNGSAKQGASQEKKTLHIMWKAGEQALVKIPLESA